MRSASPGCDLGGVAHAGAPAPRPRRARSRGPAPTAARGRRATPRAGRGARAALSVSARNSARQPLALALEPLAPRGELAVEAEGLEPLAQPPRVGRARARAPRCSPVSERRESSSVRCARLRSRPRSAANTRCAAARLDARPHPREPQPQRRVAALVERPHARLQLLLGLHHALGGGRRRRRAQVGDEVGDREVGLVADGRDRRDRGGRDRARDALLVEGPQVLEAAAAAREHDHVEAAERGSSARMPCAISAAAPSPWTRAG